MEQYSCLKKLIVFLMALVCVFGVVECGAKNDYYIRITVPAGCQGEFIYSNEEISPLKKQLTISSIDLSEDTGFVLKSIVEAEENAYECTDFPKGEPMIIDVKKGAWYTIGIAMQNPTDEDITVCFNVENVKVRIE